MMSLAIWAGLEGELEQVGGREPDNATKDDIGRTNSPGRAEKKTKTLSSLYSCV